MRKQKNKIINRAAEHLQLPKDLMLGEPIVTVTGRSDLTVENYKGILEYNDARIRLSLKRGQIEITGSTLKIEYYTNDDMKITGCIDRIEYGM